MARGLFRLWLVASAVWVGLALYAFGITGDMNSLTGDPKTLGLVLGLPLVMGALLGGLVWAGRGFSR